MLKVQVKKVDTTVKEGLRVRDQKPYKLLLQDAFVNLPNGEYRVISFVVERPYPVGNYELSDESLVVDAFGNLKLGRVVLTALK